MKKRASIPLFSALLLGWLGLALLAGRTGSYLQLIDLDVVRVLLLGVGGFGLLGLVLHAKKAEFHKQLSFGCAVVMLLTWIFFANPLSGDKTRYLNFQQYSDSLVYSAAEATLHDVDLGSYGLGFYADITGEVFTDYPTYNAITPVTDVTAGIREGYTTDSPGFVTKESFYVHSCFLPGNQVQFPSGDCYPITGLSELTLGDITYLWVQLDAPEALTVESAGSLADALLLSADGTLLPVGMYHHYESQLGLHGRVMGLLCTVLPGQPEIILPLLCCFAFALVVTVITVLMLRLYGRLPAYSFLGIFAFSSWTISFARSVYWAEFTWLLPTLAGLMLALHPERPHWRRTGYLLMLLAVMLKSMCGYEYLTFVMLCGVAPQVAALMQQLLHRDWAAAKSAFRTLFFAGLFALLGFVIAFLLHGAVRGDGDLFAGLRQIYEQDILRRALGGDPNFFGEDIAASINATIGEVVLMYLQYGRRDILGVTIYLFPIVLLSPVAAIAVTALLKRKVDWGDAAVFGYALLTSLSWIVLGKQHSYIHPHLNYVVWFYPLLPACIYLNLKQVWVIGWDIIERIEKRHGRISWLHRVRWQ